MLLKILKTHLKERINMNKLLLALVVLLPFSAQAGILGLDNTVKGEYNTDTSASTLTGDQGV